MLKNSYIRLLVMLVLVALLASACSSKASPVGQADVQPEGEARLSVVATTTIVGDVVAQVGGDSIDLKVLMSPDTDPHSYDPSPQDLTALESADVVFVNGLGLEEFLGQMVEGIAGGDRIVSLSENVQTIEFAGDHDRELEEAAQGGEEHDHGSIDPHVWMDPNNVIVWVDTVAAKLSELDPDNTGAYQANAQEYKDELSSLDEWIVAQVESIPAEQRKLVTDHEAFGYFSKRYGFELIGTVVPSTSTLAEPSAQELAALEDEISANGAPAIFVGFSVNPALAERVSQDTGVKLVPLYTGALSDADGPAPTYIDMIRYNVEAIVDALQ